MVDSRSSNSRGRPHEGKCWVIKNNLLVKTHEILSHDISFLSLEHKSGQKFLIFGIWFQFEDNLWVKLSNIQSNLSMLESFITNFSSDNILIIGDFNSDPQRGKMFDNLLKNFILRNCYPLFI